MNEPTARELAGGNAAQLQELANLLFNAARRLEQESLHLQEESVRIRARLQTRPGTNREAPRLPQQ